MAKDYIVDHVECWPDAPSAHMRGVDTYYSVSLCAADGDEISCDRGSRSHARAWEMACELADDHGVGAVEIDQLGRRCDTYR